jgi:hypothetical protein
MTLTMADSIYPANLPAGYDAYLGYVDGNWPTITQVRAMFPSSYILSLTVLGGAAVADGCDCEPGDLSPQSAATWAAGRIAAGQALPVIYASASSMAAVLAALTGTGLARGQVRLLSAHYQAGEHICAPDTCGLVPVPMDGTQWTDTAAGNNGTQIDASILLNNFFSTHSGVTMYPPLPGQWSAITSVQHLPGGGIIVTGIGYPGTLWIAQYDPATQAWSLSPSGIPYTVLAAGA